MNRRPPAERPKLQTTEFLAPAKVNLALHITGRRPDGFHLLSSLVVFVDIADRLRISNSASFSLNVEGPFADGVPTDDTNLIRKAARVLGADETAEITLTKTLPHGGGIGGGSSDAAASMRGLSDLWNTPLPAHDELLALGADIPVCLRAPAPMIMEGVGEILKNAPSLPKAWLVLANPKVSVSTPLVFRQFAKMERDGDTAMGLLPDHLNLNTFSAWLGRQRNDLTESACTLAPVIQSVLEALAVQPGCLAHRMSGSGSTCWAMFGTQKLAQDAELRLRGFHPDWWIQSGEILNPDSSLTN